MKYYIFIGMLFLAASGCKPGIPKDLIQPEEMAKILSDIHIVDSYINSVPNRDSARKVASAYYKGIYKKFKVDSVLYTRSLDYYSENPKLFSDIYKNVTSDLSKQKAVLVKADSLVNAQIAKKAKLKFKADSAKRADSIAKTPDFKKALALNKKANPTKWADSITRALDLKKEILRKKTDSIKLAALIRSPAFKKAALKRKADSIRNVRSIAKASRIKKPDLKKKIDSIHRITPVRRPKKLK